MLWTGGTRRGKAWDLFEEAAGGKQILNETEFSEVKSMHDAVRSHPVAMRYLQDGVAEVTLRWVDPHSGRAYRARVDWVTIIDGQLVFVDLKTTASTIFRKFCADAYKFGYHVQFALYTDGGFQIFQETPRFIVIAVENKAPYDVAVFSVPDEVLEHGHNEYTRLEQLLARCEESGNWPGRADDELELELPEWVTSNEDDDLSDLDLVAEEA
jgi:hypothetical protein